MDVMSTYSFGDKELHIRNDGVFIRSLKQPEKSILLSFQGWTKLITKLEEIDIEVRELNRKTRPVNYKLHLGNRVYLSVTGGFMCVDLRQYFVPYGLDDVPQNEKPTKPGIALRVSDWVQLLALVPVIELAHPTLFSLNVCDFNRKGIDKFYWRINFRTRFVSDFIFCHIA